MEVEFVPTQATCRLSVFVFRFCRYLFLLQLLRVLRIDRHRGAFETFKCVVKNHFKVSARVVSRP